LRKNWLAALCLAAIAVVGTGCPNHEECDNSSDCADNEVCTDKKCVPKTVEPPPDAGTDAGTDAGVTCSPACAAPTPVCETSSGTGVCKTCTATGGCAAGQLCNTTANNGAGVCEPSPATTSNQIAAFLAAEAGPLAAPLPIEGAYVTYLKPDRLDHPSGFFLQAQPEGPAMYVSVANAGTAIRVGDRVSLSVTEKNPVGRVRTASAVTNLKVLSQNHPVQNLVTATPPGLVVDRSNAALVEKLDEHESQLHSLRGTIRMTTDTTTTGEGMNAFQITTPAIQTASDALELHLATDVVAEHEVAPGCDFTLKTGPMWRFGARGHLLAYNPSDVSVSKCPAPRLIAGRALGPKTIQFLFDRKLKPESVQPSDFTVGTYSGTTATLNGNLVTVSIDVVFPGGAITTVFARNVEDRLGTPIGTTGNSTNVIGYTTPTSTAALVINEIDYKNPSTPDTTEFVEIFNRSDAPVDITKLRLVIVEGDAPATSPRRSSGSVYLSETRDANGAKVTSLPAGGYLVVASDQFFQRVPLPNGTLRLTLPMRIPNGPEKYSGVVNGNGVGLMDTQTNTLIDTFFFGPANNGTVFDINTPTGFTALDFREGTAWNGADKGYGRDSVHRLPNGVDRNDNNEDFVYLPDATPGAPLATP